MVNIVTLSYIQELSRDRKKIGISNKSITIQVRILFLLPASVEAQEVDNKYKVLGIERTLR